MNTHRWTNRQVLVVWAALLILLVSPAALTRLLELLA